MFVCICILNIHTDYTYIQIWMWMYVHVFLIRPYSINTIFRNSAILSHTKHSLLTKP